MSETLPSPAAATDLCGRALADKSLATFVGGKTAVFLAAATDLRGRGSQNAIPRPLHPEHLPRPRPAESVS